MARAGRGFPTHPTRIRVPMGPRGGTGTATVTFTPSATGTKHASGTGTINLTFTPTSTGVRHSSGTGAVDVTFTPVGTGTADRGIGLPIRPRPRWQFVAGPASGGYEIELSNALSRTYTARLIDNSELSFTLDAGLAQAAYLQPLSTDVHVMFTGSSGRAQLVDRLRVGQPQYTIDADKVRVGWTCLDYTAVLDRRLLYSDATLTYTDMDEGEIAWALVNYTQNKFGGNLGISKGWAGTSPTGQIRSRTYTVGDSVGDKVQELAQTVGGFDWDITPTSASGLSMGVWFPQRGSNRGVVLQQGGLMAEATVTVDPGAYANAIRYTGADTLTADELEAGDLGQMPQGRWDATFGDTTLLLQTTLDERAEWQLGWSQVVRPVWTVTLRRGAWDGPSHIWLGDTVRVIADAGGLDTDTTARVYEVAVTLDGDGTETVQLTLNGPRQRYAWRARDVEKRLRNLERR